MSLTCDLCNDAGRLRDGSACPWCNTTRWRADGHVFEMMRPKRQIWIRPSDRGAAPMSEVTDEKREGTSGAEIRTKGYPER
jgi:hypothetical protein